MNARALRSLNLAEIVGPVPEAVFLNEYFGRCPLHLPGAPERFAPLLAGLDTFADGDRVDEANAVCGLFAGRLERAFDADIQINLCSAGAFPPQTAESDLMMLMLQGETLWSVYANAPVEAPPTWRGNVTPGDALYIPRGWRFEVSCLPGGGSQGIRVLRIAIHNPTGADLIDWLIGLLRNTAAMRRDIPRFGGPGEQADFVRTVRRPLVQALRSPGLLTAFMQRSQKTAPGRLQRGVEWRDGLTPNHWIELTGSRRLRVRRADGETVFIVYGGKQLTFPEDASPLLQYVGSEAPIPMANFYDAFSEEFEREELDDFLATLSREGVISLLESDAE